MFKYTKSAINDTFDLVKKLIFIFQILIQLLYLAYLGYRIIENIGSVVFNVILTLLSIIYFTYYLITNNEFYTKRQVVIRKRVKRLFKASKYIINIWIIVLSITSFTNGSAQNDNLSLLIIMLMIVGVFFSILFDIVIMLIDNQIYIIEAALTYDMVNFREERGFATGIINKTFKIDLKEMFPELKDKKVESKIKDINYKQEQKQNRKTDFKQKHK